MIVSLCAQKYLMCSKIISQSSNIIKFQCTSQKIQCTSQFGLAGFWPHQIIVCDTNYTSWRLRLTEDGSSPALMYKVTLPRARINCFVQRICNYTWEWKQRDWCEWQPHLCRVIQLRFHDANIILYESTPFNSFNGYCNILLHYAECKKHELIVIFLSSLHDVIFVTFIFYE